MRSGPAQRALIGSRAGTRWRFSSTTCNGRAATLDLLEDLHPTALLLLLIGAYRDRVGAAYPLTHKTGSDPNAGASAEVTGAPP